MSLGEIPDTWEARPRFCWRYQGLGDPSSSHFISGIKDNLLEQPSSSLAYTVFASLCLASHGPHSQEALGMKALTLWASDVQLNPKDLFLATGCCARWRGWLGKPQFVGWWFVGRQQVAVERVWSLTTLGRNSGPTEHTGCVTTDKFPNYSGHQFLNL